MHRGATGQQRGGALGQQLAELGDGGVRHLRHVEPRQPAARVDHEQRRGVRDLAALDRRLDPVVLPDLLELRQRAGEEVPGVEHPVQLRVGPHVLDRGRRGIGVDPEQLDPRSRLAEHRLGVHHRGRRQRADGRALGVVEREDHRAAAERAQRDRLAELVRQREAGGDAGDRRPRIQFGIGRERRGLRPSRRGRTQDDQRDRGDRRENRHQRDPETAAPVHAEARARCQPLRRSAQRMPPTATTIAISDSTTIPSVLSVPCPLAGAALPALPRRRRPTGARRYGPALCASAAPPPPSASRPRRAPVFITAADVALYSPSPPAPIGMPASSR